MKEKISPEQEEEFRENLEKRIARLQEEIKFLRNSRDILYSASDLYACRIILAEIELARTLRNAKKRTKTIERAIDNSEKKIRQYYYEYG